MCVCPSQLLSLHVLPLQPVSSYSDYIPQLSPVHGCPCLFVCVCSVCACPRVWLLVCLCLCLHLCLRLCLCLHLCGCVCACVSVAACVPVSLSLCLCLCLWLCLCACTCVPLTPQVYDYDRLCPTDDMLGVAEVFFTTETLETDMETGAQKVGGSGLAGRGRACAVRIAVRAAGPALDPKPWHPSLLLSLLPQIHCSYLSP